MDNLFAEQNAKIVVPVMGLDMSLVSTGWCVLNGNTLHGTVRTKKGQFETDIERVMYIADQVTQQVSFYDPKIVYIEGFSFGSEGNALYQLGMLGGLVRDFLHRGQKKGFFTYKEIAPSSLKKFATGKGNAAKDIVKLGVYKKWGVEFNTTDETDAFVLAKMAEEDSKKPEIKEKW